MSDDLKSIAEGLAVTVFLISILLLLSWEKEEEPVIFYNPEVMRWVG